MALATTQPLVPGVGLAHPPHVVAVLRRVAASLTTAVLVPAALLWAILVTVGFAPAVVAVLAWMTGAMWWRRATGRPVSTLLVLGLVVMALRTGDRKSVV